MLVFYDIYQLTIQWISPYDSMPLILIGHDTVYLLSHVIGNWQRRYMIYGLSLNCLRMNWINLQAEFAKLFELKVI